MKPPRPTACLSAILTWASADLLTESSRRRVACGLPALLILCVGLSSCGGSPDVTSIVSTTPTTPTTTSTPPSNPPATQLQCTTDNCTFNSTIDAKGFIYVPILPQHVGTLTVTLTWPDANNDLDLDFGKGVGIVFDFPHTGNRESYTVSMQSYGWRTSDSLFASVSNESRFSSPFTLTISIN